MENMLFNELIHRGYNVDVGVVEVEQMVEGKRKKSQYEIDFVINMGNEKVYIQSALMLTLPKRKCKKRSRFIIRRTSFENLLFSMVAKRYGKIMTV